ncbi:MAG TPA: DUF5709 domain-containing protein [Microlunatus sp.]|nr:DUF5709 domain-containing protein [Microlunatus sp.]
MSDQYEDVPDPSEQLDQVQPEDSLDDRGVDDVLDEGWSPPENYSTLLRRGEHETLDQRLAEETPDTSTGDDDDEYDDFVDDGEVGGARSGRLVDPNGGIGPDEEDELWGEDVGIDGAAASAEEAAMHIIPGD